MLSRGEGEELRFGKPENIKAGCKRIKTPHRKGDTQKWGSYPSREAQGLRTLLCSDPGSMKYQFGA